MSRRWVWAPQTKKVELIAGSQSFPMEPRDRGEWTVELASPLDTADYAFRLDSSEPRPDPRSPLQREGVHGFSRPVAFDEFQWTDASWRPPSLSSAIIYELHIGTFTEAGTFDSAIDKLDYLVNLGITHVELMPVAEFSGERGWGYDGVDLFAPHHHYGGPEGLMRLVNECHRRGLAVILDVVYNHLGPDGAYLSQFGPYFTERYRTPWGMAVNLDDSGSDEVRRFLCDNALSWLRDYHFDGLRLDAVHAIFDSSAIHFLEQLATEVHALEATLGRSLVLIAESDLNQPRLVTPIAAGGFGLHAQWNDEFHHALHALITGERAGYYSDFGKLGNLAHVLTNVFAMDGQYSSFRQRTFGRPVSNLTYDHFVGFVQNHDQVGNRACGERIGHLVDTDSLKIAAAALIAGPFIPMLFQGEEWNASSPFQYFTSFDNPDLAEAVRKGRRAEFAHFHNSAEVPDPQAVETFRRSKLKWEELDQESHRTMLNWYKALIHLRRANRDFSDPRRENMAVTYNEDARWLVMRRGQSLVAFNFSRESRTVPLGNLRANYHVALASASVGGSGVDSIELTGRSVAILLPPSAN